MTCNVSAYFNVAQCSCPFSPSEGYHTGPHPALPCFHLTLRVTPADGHNLKACSVCMLACSCQGCPAQAALTPEACSMACYLYRQGCATSLHHPGVLHSSAVGIAAVRICPDPLHSCDRARELNCSSATLCCVNRFRVAGQAEADAQQCNQQLQKQVQQLQQQLQDQGSVLADTKKQVLVFLFPVHRTLCHEAPPLPSVGKGHVIEHLVHQSNNRF